MRSSSYLEQIGKGIWLVVGIGILWLWCPKRGRNYRRTTTHGLWWRLPTKPTTATHWWHATLWHTHHAHLLLHHHHHVLHLLLLLHGVHIVVAHHGIGRHAHVVVHHHARVVVHKAKATIVHGRIVVDVVVDVVVGRHYVTTTHGTNGIHTSSTTVHDGLFGRRRHGLWKGVEGWGQGCRHGG